MGSMTNATRLKEFQRALHEKALAAGDDDSADFHDLGQTWIHPVGEYLTIEDGELADDILDFRVSLITEEYNEVVEAALCESRADLLKELTDLKYVIEGMIQVLGFDSEAAEVLVHENNMAKVRNGVFKDGKLIKPKDHPKVDLSGCV